MNNLHHCFGILIVIYKLELILSRVYHCGFEPKCFCTLTKRSSLIAYCNGLRLTDIPYIPNNVANISLSNNIIVQITNGTFSDNSDLQHLDLSRNLIKTLYPRSFEGLQNLKTLILSSNEINYEQASISNCLIPLFNLSYLDMKNNYNGTTQLDISNSKTVEILKMDFTANGEAVLEKKFENLSVLKELDLSGFSGYCMMKIITPKTFEIIKQVQRLDLSKCGVNSVWKETFKQLTKLNYLDLSDNRCLTFRVLENVTLDLPYTSLKVLKMNKIHQTFVLNTELKKCHLIEIRNTNITEIQLDSNRIQLVESGALSYVPKTLKILSVADNQFSYGEYIKDAITSTVQSVNFSYMSMSHNLFEKDELCDNLHPETSTCKNTVDKKMSNDTDEAVFPFRYDNEDVPYVVLPNHLRRFYFRQCKLRYHFPEMRLSHNSIEYIDAAYNTFYEWTGPISFFYKLTYADLSYNFCSNISTKFGLSAPNLKTLLAHNNLLGFVLPEDKDGNTLAALTELETLNLAENRIPSLSPVFFKSQKNLQNLNLSGNMLENVDFVISHIRKLTFLDLSNNRLSRLDAAFTTQLDLISKSSNQLTINISGNPIMCTCDSLKFFHWLSVTKVRIHNLSDHKCQSLGIYTRNMKDLYDILKKNCTSYTPAIVALTLGMLIFLAILIIGLVYRYRWKLSYLYYMVKSKRNGFIRPITGDTDYLYDAFISYADQDCDFVHNQLLKNIEADGNLKCCIHKRDFVPGNDIATNITSAIHNSRKAVVIMSHNFLDSYWCSFEYNTARMESVYSRKKENMIIMVFIEQMAAKDLPLNYLELIQSQSYIEYPNDEYGNVVFWNKLVESLSS